MKQDRPIIQIDPDHTDLLLELITLVCLLASALLPVLYYGRLPDEIPIHFNGTGEANGYGSKQLIFLLPVITAAQYLLLRYLNKRPEKFNYPTKITMDNALHQYTTATKMIRMLNLFCTALFTYLTIHIIRSALNEAGGLGAFFVPGVLVILVGISAYYFYNAKSKKE